MRKTVALFGILAAIILLMLPPVWAQPRSIFWEEWNVVIDNVDTTNNRFDVHERYTVSFSGTFRFGQAVIPDTNLESIENVRVYEAGSPLEYQCPDNGRQGTYCVQQVAEGTSIVYNFREPITDRSQDIELQYTVVGAIRYYEGGDQIWWTAIPSDHFGYSIGSSTVRVQLPSGYAPRDGIDPVLTYGAPAEVSIDGTTVVARATQQISGNEKLEIRVQYPHDPNGRVASWQSDFDKRREFEETIKPWIDIGSIALGLLIGLGGTLGIFSLWYSKGRDPETGLVPEYLSELPSELPPAIVGALIDERVDLRDVLSTIIDLATRGYLVIEETRKEGLFGLGGSSEHTFKRTDKSLEDLRVFERNIMGKIFAGQNERSLDSLKNKFYKHIPKLQEEIYTELVTQEFFPKNPNAVRSGYTGVGTAILVIAGVIGFFGFEKIQEISPAILCIPTGIGIVGAVLSIVGQYMPVKTRKGTEEAAKWNAFREYLRNLDRYSELDEAAQNFNRFLPYAVAFGLDKSWVRRFAKLENMGVPVWYYPTYRGGYYGRGYSAGTPLQQNFPSAADVRPGGMVSASGGLNDIAGGISGGLESVSSGLTNMLDSAARTIQSQPSSSGKGGSFSGGGSFGGGSSGGGSRGFG